MAARTIRFGGPDNSPEPTEVFLWEHKYLLRKVTRSVQKALEKTDQQLEKVWSGGDGDSDKIVPIIAEGIGGLLMQNGTQAPDPKKVIVDQWKADTVDLPGLRRLLDELQEAAVAPPTT